MTSLAAPALLLGALLVGVAVIALLVWGYSRRAALWPAQSEYHGITVGAAKVYDSRSLSLMLEQLREQLRTLQSLDSKKVTDGIGTKQVEVTKDTSVTASAGSAEEKADGKSQDSKASESPAAPNLSERALDLLADQVNLSYDIFNLRLMLERAISDRIITDDEGNSVSRVQAVVGFPISIDPRAFSAGCAAIVEVELSAEKPLSLVALFPQEETRNASVISSSRVNLSGSAKASGVPVQAGYQHSQSINAIRRETDTVALECPSGDERKVSFAWEFRPTSGSPSVTPGTRQMLAVISMKEPDAEEAGKGWVEVSVRVRSYWRRFHLASQTLSNWSGWRVLLTQAPTESNWQTQPAIRALVSSSIEKGLAPSVAPAEEDNIQWYRVGDQTAVVIVPGTNFFAGTTVIIGDKTLDRPENGLVIKSEKSLQITIPISALAHEAVLNARYGSSIQLSMDPVKKYGLLPYRIETAELIALSEGQGYHVTLLLASATTRPITIGDVKRLPSPLLEINGRFATATLDMIQRGERIWLSASVGQEFVKSTSGTALRLTFPFLGKDWSLQFQTYDIRDSLWGTRCVDGATTRFRFSGGFFDYSTVPWSVFLDKLYKIEENSKLTAPANNLLELEVPTELADKYDQAFLIGPFGSAPVPIARNPSKEPAIQPGAKTLVVEVNSQTTVEIAGSNLNAVKQVQLGDKDLPFAVDSDGAKITAGLFGAGLSAPGKYEIVLVTGAKDPLKVPLFVTGASA